MNGKPYVYIVESPAPGDLFDGRTEGLALQEALKAIDASSSYVVATTLQQFQRAFAVGFPDSHFGLQFIRRAGGNTPIIHLSMHGDADGIQLTDGTIVSWHDLRTILSPINELFQSGVMVCLSTCQGAGGMRLSMYEVGKPFYATVGSSKEVYWSDALVAYITFYHWWGQPFPVSAYTCVDRMRAASRHESFMVFSGTESQQAYLSHVAAQRLGSQMAPAADPEGA